ncbi:MAG: bifunctional oligoribonuclease/PAP phosphatase NrnA [Clostridiales bacterium]|nr:bifunctional oligoribonuclease/PAP phosphatase NrnA [Clostridiales bacterium]
MFSKYDAWDIMSQSGDNVVIATHHGPDGDAVGACFALAQALITSGIYPKIILDKYNEKFDVVKGKAFIHHGDATELPCDLFIAVDCADFSRVHAPRTLFDRAKITVNIDHHINNGNFARHNFVDTTAASTCEIIFNIINMFVPINKYMAAALYMGMLTDTGGFRYSATTPKTMEIAGLLMSTGFDFGGIQREVIFSKSKAEVAAFTKALQNLKYCEDSGIAFSALTLDDMAQIGVKRTDLEGIVEYFLDIRGIEAAALFLERENGHVKVSLRSHAIDVSKVANRFDGGGHKFAAAADFEAGFEEGKKQVLEILEQAVLYA